MKHDGEAVASRDLGLRLRLLVCSSNSKLIVDCTPSLFDFPFALYVLCCTFATLRDFSGVSTLRVRSNVSSTAARSLGLSRLSCSAHCRKSVNHVHSTPLSRLVSLRTCFIHALKSARCCAAVRPSEREDATQRKAQTAASTSCPKDFPVVDITLTISLGVLHGLSLYCNCIMPMRNE